MIWSDKCSILFSAYINETLEGLRDLKCIVYLDNILVYGKTFDEQSENLEAVLMKLKSKRIKLNVSKCNFFKQKAKELYFVSNRMIKQLLFRVGLTYTFQSWH